MAQHHEIDSPTAPLEPRDEDARADRTGTRRTTVEERHRAARLEEVHRSIADRDHRDARHRCVRSSRVRMHRPPCRADGDGHRHETTRATPPPPAERDRTHDARQESQRRSGSDGSDRNRPADQLETALDERYLHFGRRPEERTTPRDERWPRQSDDRLRICDRERCRRERCAGERQQRAHGLHGAEVQEHEWCAHEERRQRSGDRGTGQFTEDSDEWRRGMSAFVARKPVEPAGAEGFGEVAERENAAEAQLKPGVPRKCGISRKENHRRTREYRIPVPVASRRRAGRSDDRHDRRAHRARRRRHQYECARRGNADRDRMHAPIVRREPREGPDDPAEDREVEPRDREDVREADRSERTLDHAVALLAVAEDERDEHRADRGNLAIGNTGEKRLAQPDAQEPAQPFEVASDRSMDGARGIDIRETRHECRRVDRDGRAHSACGREHARVSIAWKWISARSMHPSRHAHALTECDLRCGLTDRHRHARALRTRERHAPPVIPNQLDVAQEEPVPRRLLEVPCEDVRRKPALDGQRVDGAIDDDDGAIGWSRHHGKLRIEDRAMCGTCQSRAQRRESEDHRRRNEFPDSFVDGVEGDRLLYALVASTSARRRVRRPSAAGRPELVKARPIGARAARPRLHCIRPPPLGHTQRHRNRGERKEPRSNRAHRRDLHRQRRANRDRIGMRRPDPCARIDASHETTDEEPDRDDAEDDRQLRLRLRRTRADPERNVGRPRGHVASLLHRRSPPIHTPPDQVPSDPWRSTARTWASLRSKSFPSRTRPRRAPSRPRPPDACALEPDARVRRPDLSDSPPHPSPGGLEAISMQPWTPPPPREDFRAPSFTSTTRRLDHQTPLTRRAQTIAPALRLPFPPSVTPRYTMQTTLGGARRMVPRCTDPTILATTHLG